MSNEFKRCQKFLEKNGFKREDEFISYSNGSVGVGLSIDESEIVLVDNADNFLHISFDYYALIGALIELQKIPFNYYSVKEITDYNADSVDLDRLLPCPFCGKPPLVNQRENGNWEVRCVNENCGVIVMTDEKISKKLAIKTWNIRAIQR